jgi:hypothetical protein
VEFARRTHRIRDRQEQTKALIGIIGVRDAEASGRGGLRCHRVLGEDDVTDEWTRVVILLRSLGSGDEKRFRTHADSADESDLNHP